MRTEASGVESGANGRYLIAFTTYMGTPGQETVAATYTSAPVEFTWEVIDTMDTIERRFAEIDAEAAEALRQSQRRAAALAKLDAEERKLLGL